MPTRPEVEVAQRALARDLWDTIAESIRRDGGTCPKFADLPEGTRDVVAPRFAAMGVQIAQSMQLVCHALQATDEQP